MLPEKSCQPRLPPPRLSNEVQCDTTCIPDEMFQLEPAGRRQPGLQSAGLWRSLEILHTNICMKGVRKVGWNGEGIDCQYNTFRYVVNQMANNPQSMSEHRGSARK